MNLPGRHELRQHTVHHLGVVGQHVAPEPGEQVAQDVQALQLHPHTVSLNMVQKYLG